MKREKKIFEDGNSVTELKLIAEIDADMDFLQALLSYFNGDKTPLEKLLGFEELKQKVMEKIESIEALQNEVNIENEQLRMAFQQEINNLKKKVPNPLWVATYDQDSMKQKVFPTFEDAEIFMRCNGYTSHDKISKGVYRFRRRGKTNPETDYFMVHRVQVIHYA